MEPMLLTVKVPAARSATDRAPVAARRRRRARSAAMARMERAATFLMVGTRRPCGVSMAMPMLWIWRAMSRGLWVGWVSTREFSRGKSVRARETAFMMKGREESFLSSGAREGWVFRRWRRVVRGVRLISSA